MASNAGAERSDLCGVTACPYEAAVGRIEAHMDRTDGKLEQIGEDVASIKAGAVRDRWWQQTVMWFFGICIALSGLIVTVIKVEAGRR